MILNIADADVRAEVRTIIHEELMKTLRADIDKMIPEVMTSRMQSGLEHRVDKRVADTLADHMEIETTIFLQKQLNKQETFIRERFDKAIEKLLSTINIDNYLTKIVGSGINEIIDKRLREILKTSYTLEVKENIK